MMDSASALFGIGEVRGPKVVAPSGHLARGDLEGRCPDPCVRVADALASSDRLCERLGHGVVRDIRAARIQQERSPQAWRQGLEDVLRPILRHDGQGCLLGSHSVCTGRILAESLARPGEMSNKFARLRVIYYAAK